MTTDDKPPTEDQPQPPNGAPSVEQLRDACQQAINVFAGSLSESMAREGVKFNPLDATIQQRIGFIHFDALLATLISTMSETSPEAAAEFDQRLTKMFITKLMSEASELKKPKIALGVGAALQHALKNKGKGN